MRYSDNPEVNATVDLLMHHRRKFCWLREGLPIPPQTRAEIIAEIRAEYGRMAARCVRITVH